MSEQRNHELRFCRLNWLIKTASIVIILISCATQRSLAQVAMDNVVTRPCQQLLPSQGVVGVYGCETTELLAQQVGLLRTQIDLLTQQRDSFKKMMDSSDSTNQYIQHQIDVFNADLRKTVSDRFDKLPDELRQSQAFKDLKTDILKAVDDKIATQQHPVPVPPAPQSRNKAPTSLRPVDPASALASATAPGTPPVAH